MFYYYIYFYLRDNSYLFSNLNTGSQSKMLYPLKIYLYVFINKINTLQLFLSHLNDNNLFMRIN